MTTTQLNKYIFPFSLVYFAISYLVAINWYYEGFFETWNIFFDTNPNVLLSIHAHGTGLYVLRHPFSELFSFPVRLIDAIFGNIFAVSDRQELRELIALSISPIFSSLTLIYFYKTICLLNLKALDVCIFTLIFTACFTNLLFSIIPETYPISGLLITFLIYYSVKNDREQRPGNRLIWFSLALLLAGVTITNISIFCIVYTIHLVRTEKESWFKAGKQALLYSIPALLITICYYKISHYQSAPEITTDKSPLFYLDFVNISIGQMVQNLVNLFCASLNGLLAAFPRIADNPYYQGNYLYFTRDKHDFLSVFFFACIWGGILLQAKKHMMEEKWRNIYITCIPIIVFNFALHTLFGLEMFLYTQHWITPLFLLLIPSLQNRHFFSISLLLLLLVVNINFFMKIGELVAFQ